MAAGVQAVVVGREVRRRFTRGRTPASAWPGPTNAQRRPHRLPRLRRPLAGGPVGGLVMRAVTRRLHFRRPLGQGEEAVAVDGPPWSSASVGRKNGSGKSTETGREYMVVEAGLGPRLERRAPRRVADRDRFTLFPPDWPWNLAAALQGAIAPVQRPAVAATMVLMSSLVQFSYCWYVATGGRSKWCSSKVCHQIL